MAPRESLPSAEATPARFECVLCGFATHVDYHGCSPPFNKRIVFLETCFVIRDPMGDTARPICVGGACTVCKRQVCAAARCSTFYTKRFCVACLQREDVVQFLPEALLQPRERPAVAALPASTP